MNYDFLPDHLRVYVVEQEYSNYSLEDHAAWRFIIKISKNFFIENAHSSYLKGLQKTGISENQIPKIEVIDEKLQRFGWRAVCVRGFIPPLVFMDFQSRAILPIAADMRTVEHLTYTPSPDIVHESAGHSPIIIDEDYSDYLKSYGSIARKAIYSKEDIDVYIAIKNLSDLKENPKSTNKDIDKAGKKLEEAYSSIRYTSEAAMLSRMNWWTVEYGLIGTENAPKIYGAGLLSSVSESENSLSSKVKKINFSKDCMNYDYNITEQQPQLFVVESFKELKNTLMEVEKEMVFKKPPKYGLKKAIEARAVCTVELGQSLQVSGIVRNFFTNLESIAYLQFIGPTQISYSYKQIKGHGGNYHKDGYGTPIGKVDIFEKGLSQLDNIQLKKIGLIKGCNSKFKFTSGVEVRGKVLDLIYIDNILSIIKLENCKVTLDSEVLFDPSWGSYDLICSEKIESVYGGPSDINNYLQFMPEMINKKNKFNKTNISGSLDQLYLSVENERNSKKINLFKLENIYSDAIKKGPNHWLILFEILEIIINQNCTLREKIISHFENNFSPNTDLFRAIQRGLKSLNCEI